MHIGADVGARQVVCKSGASRWRPRVVGPNPPLCPQQLPGPPLAIWRTPVCVSTDLHGASERADPILDAPGSAATRLGASITDGSSRSTPATPPSLRARMSRCSNCLSCSRAASRRSRTFRAAMARPGTLPIAEKTSLHPRRRACLESHEPTPPASSRSESSKSSWSGSTQLEARPAALAVREGVRCRTGLPSRTHGPAPQTVSRAHMRDL